MSEPLDEKLAAGDGPPELGYADPQTPHPQQLTPVSRWDVTVIVVKVLGVYLFVLQGVPYLTGGLRMLADGSWRFSTSVTWVYFGVSLGFLAVGLLLFFGAARIGRWLLPKLQTVPFGSGSASPTTVQEIAFSIVGVYLVAVYAMPGLAYQGWRWLAEAEARSGTMRTQLPDFGPYLFQHLVQLFVGVLLFKESKRLSDYWRRTRLQRIAFEAEEDRPL